MKVLITGGSGFIGSHLTQHHLGKGDEVVVLDNFSTGRSENLASCRDNPDLRVIEGDVRSFNPAPEERSSYDRIYHLAAAVGVQHILDNPVQTLDENIDGVRNVLELARGEEVVVFLASTSEVYGKDPTPPFREDQDRLMGPTHVERWGYANSKSIGEHYAFGYHKEHGVKVAVGRFFNVVGPRQTGRYGMVVPRFVEQCLAGEPVTIYGDGQQTRCFADVRDVVRIVDRLLDNPQSIGQAVNIGSDREITIQQLAKTIKRLTGSNSELIHKEYHKVYGEGFEEMQRRQPELSRLRSLVADGEIRPLDQTIKDIIANRREEDGS